MPIDSRPAVYRDLHAGQLLQMDAQNHASALAILGILFEIARPQSILDVGCGLGAWLTAGQHLGVADVLGLEGQWVDAAPLRIARTFVLTGDLEQGFALGRRFDLAICLEVAEHLPEAAAPTLIAALAAHSDLILFSAAIPHQGGHHHVNEQFPDYWLRWFAQHGFRPLDFIRPRIWDDPAILWWLRQNVLVFAHERALAANARLRQEANVPRLLSVVHPAVYMDRMEQAARAQNEHAALVQLLAEEGTYVVTRTSAGAFTIARQASAVAAALALAEDHHRAGRLDEAERGFRRVLEWAPDHAEALHRLGFIAFQSKQHETALGYYRRALERAPDNALMHNNSGVALKELGRLTEAVACFRRAVQLRPDYAEAHYNLGTVLKDQGELGEAIVCLRAAADLKPDFTAAHNNLGNSYRDSGQLPEALACFERCLQLEPNYAAVHSNVLYTLQFHPDFDAPAIYAAHRVWHERYAEPLAPFLMPHENDRSPERRLRIGYVSPNFRNHAETYFTVPLFLAHDHRDFEIHCYSDVVNPDDHTARLRSCADVWRDTAALTDEQLAQLIRADGIDILVDLTMHMAGNRLLAFARKPAPVQVCWLAYQGTTGLTAIDYRLTDAQVDPPGFFDDCYSEQSIRLPDAFGCYDPLSGGPAVNELPALRQGFITFASLNNFCKVNDGVLELWAGALRAVERSQLLLLAPEGPHRQRTRAFLERQGIAGERVRFVAGRPRQEYLHLFHQIDIALDTLPYNGQTTSLDCFWMGVPVITLPGRTAVGRAGASLLHHLGAPEWIAQTPEHFAQIARDLCSDLPRLAEIRAALRGRLQASALMDGPRFARNVEAAYREMWRAWCAKKKPRQARR